MIIHSRRKTTPSTPTAKEPPKPQPVVEKKWEKREEVKKVSSPKVKKILEEIEEEVSHEE